MRIARSTGAASGLLIALLGVWGAVIPFVGPYFDYSFGVNSTWQYTNNRLWLSILPGAAALVGGLLLVKAATRAAGVFGGWLAVLAGVWFVIGPPLSLTWEHGARPIGAPLFSATRQAFELIGYFYGLGVLIVALAAFAVGRFAPRPRLARAPARVAVGTQGVGRRRRGPRLGERGSASPSDVPAETPDLPQSPPST
jgi:hypothetical protein